MERTRGMDFVSDALSNGRRIRILNIIDDSTRSVSSTCRFFICSQKVIEVLDHLKSEIGLPKSIRTDNGPEFISKKLAKWCEKERIEQNFIQPGKPMQNGFNERLG